MVYLSLFWFVIAFVIGYLSGFMLMICIIGGKLKKADQEINYEEPELEELAEPERNSLADRFTDKGDAYVDLICETEEIDKADYVEQSRKKQNEAYTYTGRKE